MSRQVFAVIVSFALVPFFATAQSQPKAEDFAADVTEIAQGELQTWINDPVLVYAIREQNQVWGNISERKITRLDKAWVKGGSRGPMVGDLIGRQASVILRDRRELSNGVITEIIVMDQQGLNVAISDPTSDFYQGDEAKYQETYLRGPGAVHVSELEFDDSTQKIQTQVSMTVVDPENGAPIGAVTFGIDLTALTN
ncbi:MAG: PDC sensor domain-containing protein [Pseudomonadota bacterium]